MNWETASEINNDFFTIEKSSDGKTWEFLTQVSGAGESTTSLNYSYQDHELCAGTCYYRLRQTDYDGTEEVSSAVFVTNDASGMNLLNVYPNPVTASCTVSYTTTVYETVELIIYSAVGEEVYVAKLVCAEGENIFNVSTDILTTGLYFMTIRDYQGKKRESVSFSKL